jgi:hypothetical protein
MNIKNEARKGVTNLLISGSSSSSVNSERAQMGVEGLGYQSAKVGGFDKESKHGR